MNKRTADNVETLRRAMRPIRARMEKQLSTQASVTQDLKK
jgi:hypothetical protein